MARMVVAAVAAPSERPLWLRFKTSVEASATLRAAAASKLSTAAGDIAWGEALAKDVARAKGPAER